MESERWRQVEELFHAALERTPEERQAFLGQACSEETAAVLNVSIDTAKRDWRMAKAWLISQL